MPLSSGIPEVPLDWLPERSADDTSSLRGDEGFVLYPELDQKWTHDMSVAAPGPSQTSAYNNYLNVFGPFGMRSLDPAMVQLGGGGYNQMEGYGSVMTANQTNWVPNSLTSARAPTQYGPLTQQFDGSNYNNTLQVQVNNSYPQSSTTYGPSNLAYTVTQPLPPGSQNSNNSYLDPNNLY